LGVVFRNSGGVIRRVLQKKGGAKGETIGKLNETPIKAQTMGSPAD
jgi:hypothetical protein